MKELEQRKRLLVAESDLNRQALQVELHHIRTSFTRVSGIVRSGRSLTRALLMAAPLATMLVSRRRGRQAQRNGLFKKMLAGYQMFRRFQPLWAAFKAGRKAGEATSRPEAGSQPESAA